jgi:hypothetical protein
MMRAVFVLTPPESKRFIAKAVARLPEVKRAKSKGEIVIGHGSTNVYVAEEIMGECPERDKFLSGQIIRGILCVTQAEEKPPMIMIRKGKRILPQPTMEETLKNFDAGSVFIKGANAVDPQGNAGVFVAHPSGGTIGYAYGILSARGCHLIVPVGLEKLIPSVSKAAKLCGQSTFHYSQGIRIGMVPIVNAKVITEVEAFQVLFGLEAVHIGGGGMRGSEGSVVLVAEGERRKVDKAIRLIESIKGEPPLQPKKSLCLNCLPTTPSLLLSAKDQFEGRKTKHCMYWGQKEEELPFFLRQGILKGYKKSGGKIDL